MPRGRDIGSAFDARNRGEGERLSNSEAQPTRVTGEITIVGTGEGVSTIEFPVLFVGKPQFSYGAQLGPGQPLVEGAFPVCSVIVSQWHERVRDDGSVIYGGATFATVASGPATQVLIAQWHMEGIALTGPTPNEE